jgi:hypothetical protein
MKILHHIGLSFNELEKRAFLNAGIELRSGIGSFEISEDDSRWSKLFRY